MRSPLLSGLIEQCGGKEKFDERLDIFFDKGFFNVNNEPSFLTPCLYHWVGRPDKSGDRIHEIIQKNYNDVSAGLPVNGNDSLSVEGYGLNNSLVRH